MIPRSIGILTGWLTGGAFTNLATALAGAFRATGVEELYLIHISRGPDAPLGLDDRVRVVGLGTKRSLWTPIALSRFLRRFSPDVLISMPTFVNLAAIVGRGLAKHARTRLIISEHATVSYKVFTEHRGEMKFAALPSLIRTLYPRADALVAVSPEVLDDLRRKIGLRVDPARARVIPNPIDAERIMRLSRERPDHPWLRPKQVPVVLSVGRLARQKNYSLLLRAFARLIKQMDARLLIVGAGPERESLRSLAERLGIRAQVDFPGYVANPYPLMAGSDVFVLTSEEEAFGMVLVEALCCGLPVVATDAIGGGPRYILDHGAFGALIPTDDERGLTDSILRVLDSPEGHAERAARAKLRCGTFSPDRIAREWLSLIETV